MYVSYSFADLHVLANFETKRTLQTLNLPSQDIHQHSCLDRSTEQLDYYGKTDSWVNTQNFLAAFS